MSFFIRRFTRHLFVTITIIVALLFIFSCLVEFLNPATWWVVGFLGLGLPYLIVVLIFLVVFWLIAKPRFTVIPILALLVGHRQIAVLFGFHIKYDFVAEKQAEHLRVLDWNIRNFVAVSANAEKIKHNKQEIVSAIMKMNADVLCLQEFNHSRTKGEQDDNIGLFSAKYPYHFFSRDLVLKNGFYEYGSIIFSKYPIIKTERIRYDGKFAESLIAADIVNGNDTIRIFTTHLQSFKFRNEDYEDMEKIQHQDDKDLQASKNIFNKMKLAFIKRGVQARKVREAINQSPHPSIIAGDFNDVPNSFTYFHIKGNHADAFLKKSFGIGRTYISLAPTLRIDYILPGPEFEVQQFEMVDEDLSDHVMLVADVKLKKQ